MRTYAVKWREPDGQTFIGRLTLGTLSLHLDGRRRGTDEAAVDRELGYEHFRGLRIGRREADRIDGRRSLVVEQPDGRYLVADAGMGAPILHELLEQLAELAAGTLRQTRMWSAYRPG